MTGRPFHIALSLVSHTNVGKTALARTLLARDIGEVRDEAHVTVAPEAHLMIETAQGDVLCLWDTPGFGDSARLARRLSNLDTPIVGFLAMVWDRWRERALWSSQQAVRNVRDDADVVLYLVNASESPSDAGYVAPELQILDWIGKPVVVMLNQTGPPREPAAESADIERWRKALGPRPYVVAVLALDAFARCWVQERTWLRAVGAAVPPAKAPAFARLQRAWLAQRESQFEAAMAAIAGPIARAACDHVPVADAGLRGSLIDVGKAIGFGGDRVDAAKMRAMRELGEHLDADLRASMERLIAIHGLDGHAAAVVMTRLADSVTREAPVDARKAAVIGGFVSGALTGLAADLAAGGLTFGAGMLAGGVVGAVGAAGVARGFNLVRGKTATTLRWSDDFVATLVPAALLSYLAVAHYGRGRGEWVDSEYPPFWRDAVAAAIARDGDIAEFIASRIDPCDAERLAVRWQPRMRALATSVLSALYPDATTPALSPSERAT